MQAKWPFVGSEQRYDLLQFTFERRWKVWTRFEEILKIRR